MKRLFGIAFLLCFFLWIFFPAVSFAQEKILSYDSRIEVHTNATMTVTETITVNAEGKEINHGIYRDFPTRYRDREGNRLDVGFSIQKVLRDGNPEPYHTQKKSNGVRIYFGSKNKTLPSGVYTYTLVYKTDRQLGFFDTYDELYWNVTGNGWAFPLNAVTAEVLLPDGAEVLQQAAYTGPKGAKGTDFTGRETARGYAFKSTRPFRKGEGLTIAVAWPKGIVDAPQGKERVERWLQNYGSMAAGILGIFVLLAYQFIAWMKVGRDPKGGAIIPRYEAPEGVSPAAARFISRMKFDRKTLAVAIVNMAVKGWLTISDYDGQYRLDCTGKTADSLSAGEQVAAEKLFPVGEESLQLEQSEHPRIGGAVSALRKVLQKEYGKNCFHINKPWFIASIVLSVAILLSVISFLPKSGFVFPLVLWVCMWGFGVFVLARTVVIAWLGKGGASALFLTLFSLPFVGGEIFGLVQLARASSLATVLFVVFIFIANAAFFHLIKAPTVEGRRIMDEIEGLKLYMQVAEKDRLNLLNPPEQTPEHFEALLPYAMALDVENEWNAQFASVLARAAAEPAADSAMNRRSGLSWYRGGLPATALAGALAGGFAQAVSSSSTAPGSSSGSGGGGSSGGGGGGGGGGGW